MEKHQPLQQPALIKARQSGFTLIELVLVLIIVGILAAASVKVLLPDNGGGVRVNTTANQVATDIRVAQSIAMALSQHTQVTFSANSYSVTNITNNPATPLWLNSGSIAFNPMISIATTSPSSTLVFDGFGVPYSNSTTPLTGFFQITLQATTGDRRLIQVTPSTGNVGVSIP